jgi:hypothetical protein
MEKFRQQAATGKLDFLADEEDEDLEVDKIMQLEEFHAWVDVFRNRKQILYHLIGNMIMTSNSIRVFH